MLRMVNGYPEIDKIKAVVGRCLLDIPSPWVFLKDCYVSETAMWHLNPIRPKCQWHQGRALTTISPTVYEEQHRSYYWRLSFPPHLRYSLEMRTSLFLAIDVGWRDGRLTFFLLLDVSSKVRVMFRYGKPTSLIVSMFCTHPDRSITLGIRWSQDLLLVCRPIKTTRIPTLHSLFCIVVFPNTPFKEFSKQEENSHEHQDYPSSVRHGQHGHRSSSRRVWEESWWSLQR